VTLTLQRRVDGEETRALTLTLKQNYQSQLQVAATKDEALTLAISAAENLMKAVKLSSSSDEKRQLKSQCGVLMDVADRIKKSTNWAPLSKEQPQSTKSAQIGQWAADVSALTRSASAHKETASSSTPTTYSDSQSVVPVTTGSTAGNLQLSYISSPSRASFDLPSLYSLCRDDCQQNSGLLIDLSDDQPNPSYKSWEANTQFKESSDHNRDILLLPFEAKTREPSPLTQSSSKPRLPQTSTGATSNSASATPIPPKVASRAHIHRLTEPVSTRKRSKKEDIILLKASVVNGFKCPPWDKNPATTDFTPQDGQALFV
jgi:calpain-7